MTERHFTTDTPCVLSDSDVARVLFVKIEAYLAKALELRILGTVDPFLDRTLANYLSLALSSVVDDPPEDVFGAGCEIAVKDCAAKLWRSDGAEIRARIVPSLPAKPGVRFTLKLEYRPPTDHFGAASRTKH